MQPEWMQLSYAIGDPVAEHALRSDLTFTGPAVVPPNTGDASGQWQMYQIPDLLNSPTDPPPQVGPMPPLSRLASYVPTAGGFAAWVSAEQALRDARLETHQRGLAGVELLAPPQFTMQGPHSTMSEADPLGPNPFASESASAERDLPQPAFNGAQQALAQREALARQQEQDEDILRQLREQAEAVRAIQEQDEQMLSILRQRAEALRREEEQLQENARSIRASYRAADELTRRAAEMANDPVRISLEESLPRRAASRTRPQITLRERRALRLMFRRWHEAKLYQLECPICFDVLGSMYLQCRECGISTCNRCSQYLARCAQCRTSTPGYVHPPGVPPRPSRPPPRGERYQNQTAGPTCAAFVAKYCGTKAVAKLQYTVAHNKLATAGAAGVAAVAVPVVSANLPPQLWPGTLSVEKLEETGWNADSESTGSSSSSRDKPLDFDQELGRAVRALLATGAPTSQAFTEAAAKIQAVVEAHESCALQELHHDKPESRALSTVPEESCALQEEPAPVSSKRPETVVEVPPLSPEDRAFVELVKAEFGPNRSEHATSEPQPASGKSVNQALDEAKELRDKLDKDQGSSQEGCCLLGCCQLLCHKEKKKPDRVLARSPTATNEPASEPPKTCLQRMAGCAKSCMSCPCRACRSCFLGGAKGAANDAKAAVNVAIDDAVKSVKAVLAPKKQELRSGLFPSGDHMFYREIKGAQLYLATPTGGRVSEDRNGEPTFYPDYKFTALRGNESSLLGRDKPEHIPALPTGLVALMNDAAQVIGIAWREDELTLGTAGHNLDNLAAGLRMFREFGKESYPLGAENCTIRRPPGAGTWDDKGTGYDQAFITFKSAREAAAAFARIGCGIAPKLTKDPVSSRFFYVYGVSETGFLRARGQIQSPTEAMKRCGVVAMTASTLPGFSGSPYMADGGVEHRLGMHICSLRGDRYNLGVAPNALRRFLNYHKDLKNDHFEKFRSEMAENSKENNKEKKQAKAWYYNWEDYDKKDGTEYWDPALDEEEKYRQKNRMEDDFDHYYYGGPYYHDDEDSEDSAYNDVDAMAEHAWEHFEDLMHGGGEGDVDSVRTPAQIRAKNRKGQPRGGRYDGHKGEHQIPPGLAMSMLREKEPARRRRPKRQKRDVCEALAEVAAKSEKALEQLQTTCKGIVNQSRLAQSLTTDSSAFTQRHGDLATLHTLKSAGLVRQDVTANESALAAHPDAELVDDKTHAMLASLKQHLAGSALLPEDQRFWRNSEQDVPPAAMPAKPTGFSLYPKNSEVADMLVDFVQGGVKAAWALKKAACTTPEHLMTQPAIREWILNMQMHSSVQDLAKDEQESFLGSDGQPVFTKTGRYKAYGKAPEKDADGCIGFTPEEKEQLKEAGLGRLAEHVIPKSTRKNIRRSLEAHAKRLDSHAPEMTARSRVAFDLAVSSYAEHLPAIFEGTNSDGCSRGWTRVLHALQHKSSGWNTRFRQLDKRQWATDSNEDIATELRMIVGCRMLLRAAAGARQGTMSAKQQRSLFLVDPKEAFIKPEDHGPEKVASGRFRIIWLASLVDTICQMLGSYNACKTDIDQYQQKGSKTIHGLGSGHHKEGVEHFIQRVQQGAGSLEVVSTDASGFDMSVPRLGILLDAERKLQTVSAKPTAFTHTFPEDAGQSPISDEDVRAIHEASAIMLYGDAFAHSAHSINFFGEVWDCTQFGMTGSGLFTTGSQNSFFRAFTLLDAGANWVIAVGDDESHTGDVDEKVLRHWGTVTKAGSTTRGDCNDFAMLSHQYLYDPATGRSRARYLNIDKMLGTNLLSVSRGEEIPDIAVAAQLSVLKDNDEALAEYKRVATLFGRGKWRAEVDYNKFELPDLSQALSDRVNLEGPEKYYGTSISGPAYRDGAEPSDLA